MAESIPFAIGHRGESCLGKLCGTIMYIYINITLIYSCQNEQNCYYEYFYVQVPAKLASLKYMRIGFIHYWDAVNLAIGSVHTKD